MFPQNIILYLVFPQNIILYYSKWGGTGLNGGG